MSFPCALLSQREESRVFFLNFCSGLPELENLLEKHRWGVSRHKLPGRNKPALQPPCLQIPSPTSEVLQLEHVSESPGGLVKTVCRVPPLVSESAGLGWSLRVCISHKFVNDAEAAGLGTIL